MKYQANESNVVAYSNFPSVIVPEVRVLEIHQFWVRGTSIVMRENAFMVMIDFGLGVNLLIWVGLVESLLTNNSSRS